RGRGIFQSRSKHDLCSRRLSNSPIQPAGWEKSQIEVNNSKQLRYPKEVCHMNTTKQSDVIASGSRLAVIVMLLCLFSFCAYGQVSGGSVAGTIKDPTGAVVPGASITIQNQDTAVKHEQTSNRDGEYIVPNLQPGNYTISCSAVGFSSAAIKNIVVGVGSALVIDLTMTVGQLTNTINVE